MTVLITGANGMLGHRVAMEFAPIMETYVTQYGVPVNLAGCSDVFIDITKPIGLVLKPDIIIHTAALTDVDYCQKHPNEAWTVNVSGTSNLVKAFPNAKFIYISTDFVFDGCTGNYSEIDRPRPINVYAQTKYVGELLLPDNSLIIRTCIFGHNIPNTKESLTEKILRKLQQEQSVALFSDLFSTPIYTGCLAKLLVTAVNLDLSGIWNIGGSERGSKYDLGLKLATIFGLNPSFVTANSAREFRFEAERPMDVSLNVKRISDRLGFTPPDLCESLMAFKGDSENEYRDQIIRRENRPTRKFS